MDNLPINQKQFNSAFQNYWKDRTDANYAVLHPMLEDLIGILFSKRFPHYSANDYCQRDRFNPDRAFTTAGIDYDDLVSHMIEEFFKSVLVKYKPNTGSAFSFTWKSLHRASGRYIQSQHKKKRDIKLTVFANELVNEENTPNHIFDELPIVSMVDSLEDKSTDLEFSREQIEDFRNRVLNRIDKFHDRRNLKYIELIKRLLGNDARFKQFLKLIDKIEIHQFSFYRQLSIYIKSVYPRFNKHKINRWARTCAFLIDKCLKKESIHP